MGHQSQHNHEVRNCRPSRKRRMSQAVVAVKSGELTLRAAAVHYRVAKSTLHDYVKPDEQSRTAVRNTALSSREEEVLDNFLSQHAWRGVPLTTLHLSDAVKIFVRTLSAIKMAS
eukprot:IDg22919t1